MAYLGLQADEPAEATFLADLDSRLVSPLDTCAQCVIGFRAACKTFDQNEGVDEGRRERLYLRVRRHLFERLSGAGDPRPLALFQAMLSDDTDEAVHSALTARAGLLRGSPLAPALVDALRALPSAPVRLVKLLFDGNADVQALARLALAANSNLESEHKEVLLAMADREPHVSVISWLSGWAAIAAIVDRRSFIAKFQDARERLLLHIAALIGDPSIFVRLYY